MSSFSEGIRTLVFSGGANRGIMLGGALMSLDKHGILKNVNTFIGTSIGALAAGLCAVGYTAKETCHVIMNINIGDSQPNNEFELYNLYSKYGCYSNKKMIAMIQKLIAEKAELSNITFIQLHDLFRTTLVVTACCVNTCSTKYLSYETTPNLPISHGICMSMTIPFMYEPFIMNDMLYVDGSMFGHVYPIEYVFKHKIESETIGIRLHKVSKPTQGIKTMWEFTEALVDGIVMTHDYVLTKTINLVCKINTLDSIVSYDKKRKLIREGFIQTEKIIQEFISHFSNSPAC